MTASSISYTAEVMRLGWYPVLASMVLSNFSGPIAESSVQRFSQFALFQVVMNGAGGNLASILASKLSTDLTAAEGAMNEPLLASEGRPPLQKKATMLRGPYRKLTKSISTMGKTQTELAGVMKEHSHKSVKTDWVDMKEKQTYLKNWLTARVVTGKGHMARVARLLLFLVIPGQLIFSCVAVLANTGFKAVPKPAFVGCYVLASICQTTVLQMVARTAVVVFWRYDIDPDNFASPLVCGMGDLVGTSFLTVAFMAVSKITGDPAADVFWYFSGSHAGR